MLEHVIVPAVDTLVEAIKLDFESDPPPAGAGSDAPPRFSDMGIEVLRHHGLPVETAEMVKVRVQGTEVRAPEAAVLPPPPPRTGVPYVFSCSAVSFPVHVVCSNVGVLTCF